MVGGGLERARVAVTFPAPHGTESITLADGDVASFGRGGSCEIRFAYAPVADMGVPRQAGRIVAAAGRAFVASADTPGHRGLEIMAEGNPPVLLGVGEGFSPAASEFRVSVHGEQRSWSLLVVVRGAMVAPQPAGGDLPTRNFELELTPMQRRVVEAYVAPMRRGRIEPATHREVAAALSYHPNSAREALYEVWARMFAAGIPMPDVSEKRVAVAEAVLLHRLFDGTENTDA